MFCALRAGFLVGGGCLCLWCCFIVWLGGLVDLVWLV